MLKLETIAKTEAVTIHLSNTPTNLISINKTSGIRPYKQEHRVGVLKDLQYHAVREGT